MAFDVNGVFQRLFNWGNDRDADINIRADRMDGEMDNLADGLTRIVAGDENFRGAVKLPNGVLNAPALAFSGSTNTGFYRKSDGNIAFVVSGAEALTITPEGLASEGDVTVPGTLIGGLRSRSTAGALDWDADSNTRVGVGDTLLRGTTAANAPTNASDAHFYTPFNFGYEGNPTARTQFAIPYFGGGVHYRYRNPNNGEWGDWREVWDSSNDGANSGLDADLLDGQHGSFYRDAGNLNAGTLPAARLSGSYDITTPTTQSHINSGANPHGVTKAQVGLGNVTNTSDAAKPVSSAQQAALDTKMDVASPRATEVLSVFGDTQGRVRLSSGTTAAGGYIEGQDPAGVRQWFLGFADTTSVPFITSGGRFVTFNTAPRVGSVPLALITDVGVGQAYESAATAWVANSVSTFSHGLGIVPKIVEAVLVMKQAVHGYAIGDEVRLSSDGQFGSTIYSTASTVRFRSTNGSGVYTTQAVGSVAYITPAQANLKIRAFA